MGRPENRPLALERRARVCSNPLYAAGVI